MDEVAKASWCRASGVYRKDLQSWRKSATQTLAAPDEVHISLSQTKQDRRHTKELEGDLRCRNARLTETTTLLVLSRTLRRSLPRARTNHRPGSSSRPGLKR